MLFAGRWCLRLFRHGRDNVYLDLREYSSLLCAWSSSKAIAPMGDSRFARCLQGGGVYVSSGTVTITSSSINGNTARYVHAFCSKVPIAPMRRLFTCLPRLSLAQLRTLPSTTVCTCGRDFLKFQSPDGINVDALALILACTTATDASVNYRMYVQQRP